jgi:hypothetical protein
MVDGTSPTFGEEAISLADSTPPVFISDRKYSSPELLQLLDSCLETSFCWPRAAGDFQKRAL